MRITLYAIKTSDNLYIKSGEKEPVKFNRASVFPDKIEAEKSLLNYREKNAVDNDGILRIVRLDITESEL